MPNSVAWIESLGWMLIHSVWLIAVIAGVSAIVLTSLRRESANARYAVGCIAMALSLASLPASLLWMKSNQPVSSSLATPERTQIIGNLAATIPEPQPTLDLDSGFPQEESTRDFPPFEQSASAIQPSSPSRLGR